jgi:cytochrome c553
MAHRIRPRPRAASGDHDLTVPRDADRDEHDALDRMLRYAKREAESQEQQLAALLIDAAIAALAEGFARSPVH